MKRPTFLEGVLVALAASLGAGVLGTALGTLFAGAGVLHLVTAVVGLSYVLYLLSRSPERVGRITTLVAWILAAGAAWGLGLPIGLYLLAHLGLIWLVRSLHFHSSLLAAVADLGLSGLGLAAALWAVLHTGSLLLGVWCFFLVQALFVVIPPRLSRRPFRPSPGAEGDEGDERFRQAERAADAALRKRVSFN